MALTMKSVTFWVVMCSTSVEVHQHLGRTCHLHLQGQKLSQARNQREAGSKQFPH
jgi:hypothetical protein